jgi:uncharacterized Zn-finger protein
MKPFETIEVSSLEIACDGGGGTLGHPKVYLHIDVSIGHIVCPYCSRNYVYKAGGVMRSGNH